MYIACEWQTDVKDEYFDLQTATVYIPLITLKDTYHNYSFPVGYVHSVILSPPPQLTCSMNNVERPGDNYHDFVMYAPDNVTDVSYQVMIAVVEDWERGMCNMVHLSIVSGFCSLVANHCGSKDRYALH